MNHTYNENISTLLKGTSFQNSKIEIRHTHRTESEIWALSIGEMSNLCFTMTMFYRNHDKRTWYRLKGLDPTVNIGYMVSSPWSAIVVKI